MKANNRKIKKNIDQRQAEQDRNPSSVSGMISFLNTISHRLNQKELILLERTESQMTVWPTVMNAYPILSSEIIAQRDEVKLRDFIRKLFMFGVMGLPFQSSTDNCFEELKFSSGQKRAYTYCVEMFFHHFYVKKHDDDEDDDKEEEEEEKHARKKHSMKHTTGAHWFHELFDGDYELQAYFIAGPLSNILVDVQFAKQLINYLLECLQLDGDKSDDDSGEEDKGSDDDDDSDNVTDNIYRLKRVVLEYLDNVLMMNWTNDDSVAYERITQEDFEARIEFVQSVNERIWNTVKQYCLPRNEHTLKILKIPFFAQISSVRNRAIELLNHMGMSNPVSIDEFEVVLDKYKAMDEWDLENQLLSLMALDRRDDEQIETLVQKVEVMLNDDSLPVTCKEACCALLRSRQVYNLYEANEANDIIHKICDFYVREDVPWSLRRAAAKFLNDQFDQFDDVEQEFPPLYEKLCQLPFQALEIIKKSLNALNGGDADNDDDCALDTIQETFNLIVTIAMNKHHNDPIEALEWIDNILCDHMNILCLNRAIFARVAGSILRAGFLFLEDNPNKLKSMRSIVDHAMKILSEHDDPDKVDELTMCLLLQLLQHPSDIASTIVNHPQYNLVRIIEKTMSDFHLCEKSWAMRTILHQRKLSHLFVTPDRSLLEYVTWVLRVAISFIIQHSSGDVRVSVLDCALALLQMNPLSRDESHTLLNTIRDKYWTRLASDFYQIFYECEEQPLVLSFYLELCLLESHPQSPLAKALSRTFDHFSFLDAEDQCRATTILMALVTMCSNSNNNNNSNEHNYYRFLYLQQGYDWHEFLVKRVKKWMKQGVDCQIVASDLRHFLSLW